MNTMTYKGYTARVEYDERDNIFVGRVLGIRTIISFHGKTSTSYARSSGRRWWTTLPTVATKAYGLKKRPLEKSCCECHPSCTALR